MNLLEETLRQMERVNRDISDIIYIGNPFTGEYIESWSDFVKEADKEYDSGYGGHEVNLNLRIVFKDLSYLRRAEYDGSEWWTYVELFNYDSCKKTKKACVWEE